MNARPCLASGLLMAALVGQESALPLAPEWPLAEVQKRLAATELKDVAWAGYAVQCRSLQEAVPAVRTALARLATDTGVNSEWARLQLLDTLIQLGAQLSAEELLPHAVGSLRVPSLILAARQPAANRSYFLARMAALAGDEDIEWRTCGNLLAAYGGQEFVARCLWHLEFSTYIRVVDDIWLSCHGGLGCGGPTRGEPPRPADFPPTFCYVLDECNASCKTRAGFLCVAWKRIAVPKDGVPEPSYCREQQAWRDWLMAHGGVRTAAACAEIERTVTCTWTGLARLRAVVRDEQRHSEREFALMLAELVKTNAITKAQAARSRHYLHLQVDDHRGNPHKALPAVKDLL